MLEKFDDQLDGDLPTLLAVEAGRTVHLLSPTRCVSDRRPYTTSSNAGGTTSASPRVKPFLGQPKSSKTRCARKRASDGGIGQPVFEHQSGCASTANSLPSRRKSGASPAMPSAFPKGALPDLHNAGIGSDADARQAESHPIAATEVPAAHNNYANKGGCRVDHHAAGAQSEIVDPVLIEEIRMQWRMRQLWLRAEVSLTLQAKSFCRRLAEDGDKKEADVIYKAALGTGEHPMAATAMAAMLPLLASRDGIEIRRAEIEKALERLAKRLPVADFIKETRGASLKGLAAIVGEAGDLALYSNPAKLWKRMGLAPHDGKAYSTWRSKGGLSAQDWTEAGYSPKRRSAIFVIGGSLIGGMGRGKRPLVGRDISDLDWSPLEKLFVERLRHEAERDPENMGRPATAEGKESFSKWASARAQRYVEKRFLRLLWQAWNRLPAVAEETTTPVLPAAESAFS